MATTRPGGWAYREQIGANTAGKTVLAHLASTYVHSSPDVWLERLTRGEVEVDGVVIDATAVLRPAQILVWHRPAWDEPPVPMHYDLCYEDANIVAVAKPSGLPSMAAGGFLRHTLLALVRSRYPEARPVHRLGRHTSGIVVFARSAEAAAALGHLWREREVTKHYLALASGVAMKDRFEIAAPIGPVPHRRLGSVHAVLATGKPSQTLAIVLERRRDSTLLRVDIRTGRPHQIRIHLAHAGHPLVGDRLYGCGGLPLSDAPALPGDGGYLLHAERLRFLDPVSRVPMDLTAPAPFELQPSCVPRSDER
jgi:23S rRNA pseudouridine1911/1915/1917 synthase